MAFPSTILANTNPSGTSLLTSPDHAAQHSTVNSDLTAVEQKIGLGAGTPTLSNKLLVASGDGTAIWSGTAGTVVFNNSTFGTPSITGGTVASALIGTSQMTGGTQTAITSVTRYIGSAVYSGTVSGTSTLNLALATRHLVNMPNSAGAVTLALSNVTANQPFLVEVLRGTAGLGTITWWSGLTWINNGTTPPTQGTTASRKDSFGFMPTSGTSTDGYVLGLGG